MGKSETVVLGIALAIMVALVIFADKLPKEAPLPAGAGVTSAGEYKITGPFTYDNLSIFLIHGKSTDNTDYITLEEGLRTNVVVVSEKGGGENAQVDELEIENRGVKPCYVQAGDIVKGGKQDRTLAVDFVVPPRSGKKPIQSFCVESARWHTRASGGAQFAITNTPAPIMLSTKDLKIAAKAAPAGRAQGVVWRGVEEQQEKLQNVMEGELNISTDIKAKESTTSLALSLENKDVQRTVDGYVKSLSNVIAGGDDVIGYCFAINGKLNSADIYGSSGLFKKLWQKNLRSAATEALSEYRKDAKFETPSNGYVANWLNDMGRGKRSEKKIAEKAKMITDETKENILFDTEEEGKRIHRNYIKK